MRAHGLRIVVSSVLFVCLALSAPVSFAQQEGEEPSVGNLFIQAYDKKDEKAMRELIRTRTNEFPMEVKAMVEYAMSPGAHPREQDFLFNIALIISTLYKEQTGDGRLLEAVKGNYMHLMERRKASALSPEAVEKTKKDLAALGGGDWRVNVFRLNPDGSLSIEIDVKESSGGAGFTPRVDFKTSQKAKEVVKKNLPKVNKGKIVWSSMGVGLKTVFLD